MKVNAHLNTLSGDQFDREYMAAMVADHQKLLAKLQDKAQTATDPAVKNWAATQAPIVQEHLRMAQDIQRSLGSR